MNIIHHLILSGWVYRSASSCIKIYPAEDTTILVCVNVSNDESDVRLEIQYGVQYAHRTHMSVRSTIFQPTVEKIDTYVEFIISKLKEIHGYNSP